MRLMGIEPTPIEDAKWISLTKGMWTLVDEDLYEEISKYQWYCDNSGYARRNIRLPNGSRTALLLHRFIMDMMDKSFEIDHKNRNRLDNRRNNLRICKRADNVRNQKKRSDGNCASKGVQHKGNRYRARIQVSTDKRIFLGSFSSEAEASQAYDNAARKNFKEFALTNKELQKIK